jgi:predicted helicase
MKHFVGRENVGLMLCRQQKIKGFRHVLVHRGVVESSYVSNKTSEIGSSFPLYLYADDGSKIPNFKKEIVGEIEKIIGKVSPEDIFDYIYAVLHSPNYREKYKEFLKIDFPRVPYPKNKKQFFELVKLGTELRELHLMESKKLEHLITTYSETGDDKVEKVEYKDGKVFINKMQYFGGVPDSTWNFYIGGYQPAQKWLKDRKGRTLTNADIEHYQKIIVVLVETNRIMKEIDKI